MKVGDKINCWTIININPPPEHRYHLLCRCVCGNEKWVSGSALRRGKSKSYRAYITVDRKQINLGTFGKLEDAVKARRNAEERYFSERQKRVNEIKREVMKKER